MGADICEGLEKAHRCGVLHRDLKPSNIMLTKSGAKLMDFGLAKPAAGIVGSSSTMAQPLTAERMIVGTFHYVPHIGTPKALFAVRLATLVQNRIGSQLTRLMWPLMGNAFWLTRSIARKRLSLST